MSSPHLCTCSIIVFETGCGGGKTTLGVYRKIILPRVSPSQLIFVPTRLVFVVLFSWVCALRKKLATEELKRLGLGAHSKKAELVARLEEYLSTELSRAEPSRVMPSQMMVDCCLCWLRRTRGHDGLIKINKIIIKIYKILHRPPLNLHGTGGRGLLSWPCQQPGWQFFSNKQYPWWIVGLYTTPHSIFMAPAVGGVTHGPVNARRRAERPQTAHRRRWRPWLAVPRMTNYIVKNCHGGLLGNTSTPTRFSWRRR